MGDVLLDFRHGVMDTAASLAEDRRDAQLLLREIFLSPWWIRMDRGGDEETSWNAILRALPPRLREAAGQVRENWDAWLIPIPQVNDLARELAGQGYGLYLLSNTSRRYYRFEAGLPVRELLRGKVLSCEEGVLKPDPVIYRRLLDRYDLKPEECFFIDDAPANIEAARYLGMAGHCFRDGVEALKRELKDHGVESAP